MRILFITAALGLLIWQSQPQTNTVPQPARASAPQHTVVTNAATLQHDR